MLNAVPETWTEVRCICCVPLGWYSSRLLLRVRGALIPQEVQLELKCPRCDSVIEWTYGKPLFNVIKEGRRNYRRQVAAFE